MVSTYVRDGICRSTRLMLPHPYQLTVGYSLTHEPLDIIVMGLCGCTYHSFWKRGPRAHEGDILQAPLVKREVAGLKEDKFSTINEQGIITNNPLKYSLKHL